MFLPRGQRPTTLYTTCLFSSKSRRTTEKNSEYLKYSHANYVHSWAKNLGRIDLGTFEISKIFSLENIVNYLLSILSISKPKTVSSEWRQNFECTSFPESMKVSNFARG